MKKININKEMLFDLLTKNTLVGQGGYGVLSEYDDTTLIKIYYKQLLETYLSKKKSKLDEEIDLIISTTSIDKKEKEEKRNEYLEKIGYLKGIVYYREVKVGVLLEYYKDYEDLCKIYPKLSKKSKKYILIKIREKLDEFISNNIYPLDLKIDNILINPNTLDIIFIDLDDKYTIYEEKDIKSLESCYKRYEEIVKKIK